MIIGKEALVEEFALHRLGGENKDNVFSDFTVTLKGEEEQDFLRRLFLKPFANMAFTSEFTHAVGLEYNVLHGLCNGIAEGKDLLQASEAITKHLIDVSQHHKIKGGDLFVAKLSGVQVGSAVHEAVGIYKFDEKEVFIETRTAAGGVELSLKRGFGTVRPNKACLVLFTPESPTVFIVDDGTNTEYWQQDFIGHRPKQDHVNSTNHVLDLTRNFITQQLPQDYEIAKADQIDLLNRSVQYFKSHDAFDKEEFTQEVFQDERAIRSFNAFSDRFQDEHHVELQDSFEISSHAVKRQARVFKSVLKLDKNFHIYIHGDRNRIEQGVDADGRKFYKIYYDQES
ncbi:MAG TPA: nucleoid-associated protein [Flavobacteriales bacterium]